MRAEYVLAATRLQDIVKRSRDLQPRALILGLAEEAVRSLISAPAYHLSVFFRLAR